MNNSVTTEAVRWRDVPVCILSPRSNRLKKRLAASAE
jgi:hypothetical protein